MKRDFFFILVVLLAGIAGIIYSKATQKETLTLKQREVEEKAASAAPVIERDRSNISYRSLTSYRASNRDLSGATAFDGLEHNNTSLLESYEDSKADQNSEGEVDSGVVEQTWSQMFNAWYVVFVDSSAPSVNVESISSRRECELIIDFTDKSLAVLTLSPATTINTSTESIIFTTRSGKKIEITPLDNVSMMVGASNALIQFCSSY